MVIMEAPTRPDSLDEYLIEECEWNDAGFAPEDMVGLTPEDMVEWLPPGLPAELECEAFSVFEFAPVKE